MVKLSVNINKIATLRNARGENKPNVLQAALDIERFGADGITVHPRPDGRHIRYADVLDIKKAIKVEFNIEGYPSRDYIDLIKKVNPEQATLVPDAPGVITSDAGWHIAKNEGFLMEVISELKSSGARVSLFIDPQSTTSIELETAKRLGASRVELYTKAFADEFSKGKGKNAVGIYQKTAKEAFSLGLDINAGHDLNLENLKFFALNVPELIEVSIGHALICDALYFGLNQTVQKYLEKLRF